MNTSRPTPLAVISLPLATVSEANRASSEHWRTRHRRASAQVEATITTMRSVMPEWQHVRLPVIVVLTRYSSGTLDDGNLGAALKYAQDGVTDALGLYLPKGLGPRPHNVRAPGFARPTNQHYDDRDRFSWQYAQRKCSRGSERVEVRFYEPGAVARWVLSELRSTEAGGVERWARDHAAALDTTLAALVQSETERP